MHLVGGPVYQGILDGAHPRSHGGLERIALFAKQTMIVVGSIDVEMPVY